MRALRALCLAAVMLAVLPLPAARAVEDVQPARVEGADRIETAANAARLTFPAGNDGAILATAVTFPDALAAGALAGVTRNPILLTFPDRLSDATAQALADLDVDVVTIVGGPLAVSDAVQQDLESRGYAVERISGQNKYDTAARIALEADALNDPPAQIDGQNAMFLANGDEFPDALAGSAPSYETRAPLLLTEADDLPDPTSAAIDELAVEHAYILGGTAAVSAAVEAELNGRGVETTRLAGASRTETAVAVAEFALAQTDFDGRVGIVARSDAFPDALAAGPLGGETNAPILLADGPDALGTPARQWLTAQCATLSVVQAMGGTGAISSATLEEAEDAAESCGGGTSQTLVVAPQEPSLTPAGSAQSFAVNGRYDGEPLGDTVDLALFPCTGADVLGAGPDRFPDADGDGHADGLGGSNSGAAFYTTLNGIDIEADRVLYDAEVTDGATTWETTSDTPDCALQVAWQDTDGDGELDVDGEGTPTEPYGVGRGEWHETGASGAQDEQRYVVEPEGSAEVAAPGGLDYALTGRTDGQPLPGSVDLALLPCEGADVVGEQDVFPDADDDGNADGTGATDTGQAVFTTLNGEDINDQHVLYDAVVSDGQVTWTLFSQEADCALVVAWQDETGDGNLDVDRDGRPIEPYSVRVADWD